MSSFKSHKSFPCSFVKYMHIDVFCITKGYRYCCYRSEFNYFNISFIIAMLVKLTNIRGNIENKRNFNMLNELNKFPVCFCAQKLTANKPHLLHKSCIKMRFSYSSLWTLHHDNSESQCSSVLFIWKIFNRLIFKVVFGLLQNWGDVCRSI